ncbi:hypothetical protein HAZT_HAZT012224, partial [Hyalella azteca]
MTHFPAVHPPDPCAEVGCEEGKECVVGADGSATCACATSCPRATTAPATPVCASDGRDYASACALRREACVAQREI